MTSTEAPHEPQRNARKRRTDGERSRSAILQEAARLATTEGLEGLSIGRLADAVGMSKSGLFAHFGSKEELQLATIDAATAVFDERVIAPASAEGSGIERLRGLAEAFLRHLEDDVFPGGCFFASVAAEMDTRPGPVRDRAVQFVGDWIGLLVAAVRDAQTEGDVDPAEDAEQLGFEIEAYLLLANGLFVASRDRGALDRARRAIDTRLACAAPRSGRRDVT